MTMWSVCFQAWKVEHNDRVRPGRIVPRPIGFDNLLSTIDIQPGSNKGFGRLPVRDRPSPSSGHDVQLQFDGGRSFGKYQGSERFLPGLDADIQDEEKITGEQGHVYTFQ